MLVRLTLKQRRVGRLPARRYAGVTGFWFGKNPGLDRAADAIRHATMARTTPLGEPSTCHDNRWSNHDLLGLVGCTLGTTD